jgi:CheY-like chemotaxis protein
MPSRRDAETVLIVDDDPEVREALGRLLEDDGWAVTTAADGQEALARLQQAPPPALILLDLMLPVMDGFEFRVRQLEDPQTAGIPVIVFSAGRDPDKLAGLRAAASLTKPIDPDALLAIVARCRSGG